jgi:hypothetical protein
MPEPSVVAVLSSGRSGTRWLADGIRELCPGVEVEHQPIGPLYKPRWYFRRYDDPGVVLTVPEVRRHVTRIAQLERPYVETGWPLLSALPLLAEVFGDRLRIVHLTRHPVTSALAHLADRAYAGSERDTDYTRLATLDPLDHNVFQPHYARIWHRMSPYEKCLFWWTEVHSFGLELPGRIGPVPFIRIKAEQVVGRDRGELERLLRFMELPWDRHWLEYDGGISDALPHEEPGDVDPLEVHRHPTTIEVARELGYTVTRQSNGEPPARGVSS